MAESDDLTRLQVVAHEIGQHEHQAVSEMHEREIAAANELEAGGYWDSGFIDSVTGERFGGDPQQDYEDAVGQIINPLTDAMAASEGNEFQRRYAHNTLENAIDGEPIELDLGSRHFYVREVRGKTEAEWIAEIQDRYDKSRQSQHEHYEM
jgi:hypothetical protein